MEAIVIKVVEQAFGHSPSFIEEIKGKGKNNLVYKITLNKGPVILRLNERKDAFDLYKKEAWCAEVARSKGISTPAIIKTGTSGQYSFSFQEFIEGDNGLDVKEKTGDIWFALGGYARLLHEIEAPNIMLDYKQMISSIFANDYFIVRNIFTPDLSAEIQKRLEETFTWEFAPKLCHGNLHPSNVIVGTDGTIHLIDWETATGNSVPQAELAEIYTWNTGKENISRFLDGYDLKESEVNEMMRDIQTLILLRLVHVVVRKMPKDDAWQYDTYIQETAERLAQIEDYSQNILFTKNL